MKKICFVATVPGTLRTFVNSVAVYLHENCDYDVTYISSYNENIVAEFPPFVHYHQIDLARGMNAKGIKAYFQLKKIFKSERFDIVQYSTPNAAIFASLAAKRAKIPVRLYCQWGYIFEAFSGVKRKIFQTLEKLVSYNSTWVETISKSNLELGRKLKLFPESKSSVVWNGSACGVDLEKFDLTKKPVYRVAIREKYNVPQDAFVFGFVGRITGDKGINEVLASFKTIFEKNSNTYLFMVGNMEKEYSINAELLKWARENKNIIIPGRQNDMQIYFSAFDCFVLPTYREGFGEVMIEAGAMELPVITTNVPGPKDSVIDGETGLLVDRKNVPQLTEAMEKIMNDSSLREKLAKNAREFVANNYDRKILIEKMAEDKERLLNMNKK